MSETTEERLKQLRASPIYPLVTQFCAAPFRLAPELEIVLERILRIKAVRIVPTTSKGGMVFHADPSDGSITAGIRSMERLWAFCWIFALMQREKERIGGGRNISLAEEAKQLLYWAHRSATDEILPYPGNGPIPDSNSKDLQMMLAVELFLGASATILFHELGHILKHRQSSYRLTQDPDGRNKAFNHSLELEADKLAYDCVFTEWRKYSCDGRVLTKRVILFGTAFAFLLADAALSGESLESHTHPSPFRRLRQFVLSLKSEFPQMEAEIDTGVLWIANFVYAVTASLWKDRVLAIRFDGPQEVLDACERVFVPATL